MPNPSIPQKINPNQASLKELTLLPGVGAVLAKRIIEARPFHSVEDLCAVNGVGQWRGEQLAEYLDFSSSNGSHPAASQTPGNQGQASESPLPAEEPLASPSTPPSGQSSEPTLEVAAETSTLPETGILFAAETPRPAQDQAPDSLAAENLVAEAAQAPLNEALSLEESMPSQAAPPAAETRSESGKDEETPESTSINSMEGVSIQEKELFEVMSQPYTTPQAEVKSAVPEKEAEGGALAQGVAEAAKLAGVVSGSVSHRFATWGQSMRKMRLPQWPAAPAESAAAGVPPAENVPAAPAQTAQPVHRLASSFTLSPTFWAALITLILAVIISLSILNMVNGGLNYVSPAELRQVQRQAEAVNARADTLQQDMNGLRTRIDSLEALGGRISSLEKENQALKAELNQRAQEISQLQEQARQLNEQIAQLKGRVTIFDRFLEGLRGLLNQTTQP